MPLNRLPSWQVMIVRFEALIARMVSTRDTASCMMLSAFTCWKISCTHRCARLAVRLLAPSLIKRSKNFCLMSLMQCSAILFISGDPAACGARALVGSSPNQQSAASRWHGALSNTKHASVIPASAVLRAITGNRHVFASCLPTRLDVSFLVVYDRTTGGASADVVMSGLLDNYKVESLLAAGNEGLTQRADGVLVLLQHGAGGDVERIVSSKEQVQLDWSLNCRVHLRHCTPHSICAPSDLICIYCASDEELEGLGKKCPSSHERGFWECMQTWQMVGRLRIEVKLGFWGGLIDYVDGTTGVLIQVDGEHHFAGRMHGESCMQRLDNDARMCIAAWRAGRVLVRVHHLDVKNESGMRLAMRAMRAVTAGRKGPVLVFSKHFDTRGSGVSAQRSLVGVAAAQLGGQVEVVHRAESIIIAPKPVAGTSSP